jgi:peroxiredoxin
VKPSATVAQIGFIVVAAVGVYAFVGAAQHDMRRASCSALCKLGPTYAGADRKAPDFELPDMDGRPVRLSSFRGKIVVLNFWTKTCNPCLQEMPSVNVLSNIAKKRGDFVVLTVSTDDGPDAVRDTLKVALEGDPSFPVLFDPEAKVVGDKYGTHLYPETWIIDKDGVIRARFDSAKDWSTALALEAIENLGKPNACRVEFSKGKAQPPFAGLCEDDS